MVCCVSAHPQDLQDTLATLRFGVTARKVKTAPKLTPAVSRDETLQVRPVRRQGGAPVGTCDTTQRKP